MKKAMKKRKPQDATLRNVRAARKRTAALTARVARIERALDQTAHACLAANYWKRVAV